MSKRKRSAAEDDTAADQQIPRKTRVIDGQDSSQADALSRAAARQAKSERRSKKKDGAQKASTPKKQIPDALESLIPDQLPAADADHFSGNNDSVALSDAADTLKPKSPKKSKPSKKSSSQPSKNDTQQQHRFILFIGNLPFSTTPEAINYHFRALQPFEVRCMTDKATKKFRGTAFVEFPNYDKMKTCLKLYHHSLFDPEAHLHAEDVDPTTGTETTNDTGRTTRKSKTEADSQTPHPAKDTKQQWQKPRKDKTRRINVELTAGGGGGKSTARREKILNKNAKLAEERERFAKKEAEEREKNRLEGGDRNKGKGTGANADTAGSGDGARGHVHPSRMQRVRG